MTVISSYATEDDRAIEFPSIVGSEEAVTEKWDTGQHLEYKHWLRPMTMAFKALDLNYCEASIR